MIPALSLARMELEMAGSLVKRLGRGSMFLLTSERKWKREGAVLRNFGRDFCVPFLEKTEVGMEGRIVD